MTLSISSCNHYLILIYQHGQDDSSTSVVMHLFSLDIFPLSHACCDDERDLWTQLLFYHQSLHERWLAVASKWKISKQNNW